MKTLRDLSNKAILKFIIVALLALGLTGMVPAESRAASGSISGIVTDVSGSPVPDVYVIAYDLDWNPVRSDWGINGDGTYTLSSLETGLYYVQVYSYIPDTWGDPGDYMIQYYDDKAGWNNAVAVSVTDGADTPGIDFALVLGGSVSGTVLDEMGYPLPYDGYELMVDVIDNRWEYIRFGLVNPDGTYRVGGIKTGSYHVKTDSTYFEWDYDSSLIVDEYYNDTYDHNMANPVQVRLGEDTPGINFNLATTDGTITGSVLDTTGNPIADASVTAEESTTGYQKSNSSLTDGHYSIIALPPGNYVVTASDSQGVHATEEYPTEVVVDDGVIASGIDFTLALGGAISGTITDSAGGSPQLSYVYVFDSSWNLADSVTANNGSYTTTAPLQAGSYYVKAEPHPSYNPNNDVATYYNGTPVQAEATLVTVAAGAETTGIDIAFSDAEGTVSGTVTDSLGNPLANVRVYFYDSGWSYAGYVYTDSSGSYSVDTLRDGDYYAWARLSGYMSQYYDHVNDDHWDAWENAVTVPVSAGVETTGIDFTLLVRGSVSGTVTDELGNPLPGISIYLYDSNWTLESSSNTTDSSGNYQIYAPWPGPHYVRAHQSSYTTEYYNNVYDQASATSVTITTGADTPGIDFALELRGSISGTVTDALGAPLSGATVILFDSNGISKGSAATDSSGNYTASSSSAGPHYVRASLFSYVTEYYDNAYDQASATAVNLTAGADTPGIDIVLEMPGTVSGTVTDPLGAPLPGATVTLYDSNWADRGSAATDSSGNYTASSTSLGAHYVKVTHSSYATEYYDNAYDQASATAVNLTPGVDMPGIDIVLEMPGTVSGTVTDPLGAPLPGATVTLYDSNWYNRGSAATDSSGNYTASSTSLGAHYVKVIHSSYATEYYDNAYDHASATTVTITGGADTPGIDIALETNGTISGTARFFPSGTLITNATAYLYGSNWVQKDGVSLDSNGQYEFLLPEPGSYYVRVARSHYYEAYYDNAYDQASATLINVTPGSEVTADITVASVGTITGTLTFESGNPVHGGRLYLYDSNWRYVTYTQTDANGNYSLRPRADGQYYILAKNYFYGVNTFISEYYENAYDQASATAVSAAIGVDTPGINFVVEQTSISGTITDVSGNPIKYIKVDLYNSNWEFTGRGGTDSSGNYTAYSSETGPIYAMAFDPLYSNKYYPNTYDKASATPITLTAGANTPGIDFTLDQRGSISGTVTDDQGVPLSGATVRFYDSSWTWTDTTTTDASGNYTDSPTSAGNQYVLVLYSTFINEYYDNAYDQASATAVNQTAGADTQGIDFALERYGSVSGTVVDQTGAPVVSADVNLYSFDSTTSTWDSVAGVGTNSSGVYTFNNVTPGTYRVGASKYFGYSTTATEVFYLSASDVSTASDVVLTSGSTTSNIDMTLTDNTGTITGFITDASGREHNAATYCSNVAAIQQNPVTGALEVKGSYYGSEGIGPYKITGLLPGDYMLLSFPDYCRWAFWIYDQTGMGTNSFEDAKLITVGEGETVNIDIPLPLRSSVSGTITDTNGNPISGVRIRLENMQHHYVDYEFLQDDIEVWDMLENTTDSDGNFRLTMLPGGNYFVYVYDENGVYETTYYSTNPSGSSTMVDLHPGEVTTGIDIQVETVVP